MDPWSTSFSTLSSSRSRKTSAYNVLPCGSVGTALLVVMKLLLAFVVLSASSVLLLHAQNTADSQTSLATLYVPIYPGLTSHPKIQERASLLIEQVICQSIQNCLNLLHCHYN